MPAVPFRVFDRITRIQPSPAERVLSELAARSKF
jgi:hypothetical protein